MTLALVYDGGCPFCRQFALATELTEEYPCLSSGMAGPITICALP